MEAIKAMIKDGRIETDGPVNLPNGTQVLIVKASDRENDWENSPEAIASWLKWYDSLEPLIFTDEEREALEEDKKARKAWELAHADEHDQKLREMWE